MRVREWSGVVAIVKCSAENKALEKTRGSFILVYIWVICNRFFYSSPNLSHFFYFFISRAFQTTVRCTLREWLVYFVVALAFKSLREN